MELLLLLLFALIISLFNYCEGKRIILFPGLVSSVSWFFCISVAFFSALISDVEVSYETVFIIAVSIISFSIGSYLANKLYKKENTKLEKIRFTIKNKYLYLFVALGIVAIYFQLDYLKKVSYLAGGYSSVLELFSVSRTILHSDLNTERIPIILTFLKILTNCFACISLFAYFYRYDGKNVSKKYLIIPIIYMLLELVSTNRNGLLKFIMYGFSVYSIIKYRMSSNKGIGSAMSIAKATVILFSVFYIAGMLTNKVQGFNMFSVLSAYTGDAIIAFDKVVSEDFEATNSKYWGQGLFNLYYNFLYLLPLGYEKISSNLNMVYWNGGSTNIYTSLLYYWKYLGIFGCICLNMLIGIIFGHIYQKAFFSKSNFALILYSYIIFVLTYFPIAERFFSYLLTITSIIEITILFIFYSKILVKDRT